MSYKVQFRRDTAANWTAINPILAQGELGWEVGTNNYKIGDGVTAWNDLGYIPISGASINNGKLTIKQDGTVVAEFTANQSGNVEAEIISPTGSTFIYEQTTASDAWLITHNLDRYPSVIVVNDAGDQVEVKVKYMSTDICAVLLNSAHTGKAYLN